MTDLDFDKLNGLLAVIIQDAVTQRVLMVGFMNAEAYERTLETGFVVFFSRS
ncbi:MAG: phosphoribosyl-AMP cyclohydrolase, partial [Acidimicrobiia bacterium]